MTLQARAASASSLLTRVRFSVGRSVESELAAKSAVCRLDRSVSDQGSLVDWIALAHPILLRFVFLCSHGNWPRVLPLVGARIRPHLQRFSQFPHPPLFLLLLSSPLTPAPDRYRSTPRCLSGSTRSCTARRVRSDGARFGARSSRSRARSCRARRFTRRTICCSSSVMLPRHRRRSVMPIPLCVVTSFRPLTLVFETFCRRITAGRSCVPVSRHMQSLCGHLADLAL